MKIAFYDRRLAKDHSEHRRLVRRHGERRAKLIRRRLDQLRAALTLADLRQLPGPRCHELTGDRAGQLSVDLDHPYRLILMPSEPVPTKAEGGLDWTQVTAVIVLGVEDTHG
jgi:plasmid maintenance system killer protein